MMGEEEDTDRLSDADETDLDPDILRKCWPSVTEVPMLDCGDDDKMECTGECCGAASGICCCCC